MKPLGKNQPNLFFINVKSSIADICWQSYLKTLQKADKGLVSYAYLIIKLKMKNQRKFTVNQTTKMIMIHC